MIVLNSEAGNFIISRGKKYSYFAGNNYLGLAGNPEAREAAINAITKYGNSFSASRQTTGTSSLHIELESQLSSFKEREDTVTFASGYLGNTVLLDILKERYSSVLMDEYSHPSIVSGIPSTIKNVARYNHLDTNHLETLLHEGIMTRPLIITDGIFALTGEIAPLDKIYSLAIRYEGVVIVDDAHSTGVLGRKGKGTTEYFNLEGAENLYQSETLSKALGSYGGFISSNREIIDSIRRKSPVYQASTSLPPSVVAAGTASLKIMVKSPELRIRLLEMAGIIRKEITGMDFLTTQDKTQIIPVLMPSPEAASDLSAYLEENGIIVPSMNYPSMRDCSLLRIAVSAGHTDDQIEKLLKTMKNWKINNGKAYDQKNAH